MPVLDHTYVRAAIPRTRRLRLAMRGVLPNRYEAQSTFYWCGPASTRIALSCRGVYASQADMARALGTDTDGTDDIRLVVRVLNQRLVGARYSDLRPTTSQVDAVWDAIVKTIDGGYGMVANIVATAGDHPPGYPNTDIWHYVALVGYELPGGRRLVVVSDPARFSGLEGYRITVEQLTRLVGRQWKGIAQFPSAPAPGLPPAVVAAIAPHFAQLGPT